MLLLGTLWLVKNSPFWFFFGLVEDTVSTRPHLLPYISLYFLCIPSRMQDRTLSFPYMKYHFYKNQTRNCSLIPTSPAVRTCLKCGPVYLRLLLVPVSHCPPEVTTFLLFPARISLPVYLTNILFFAAHPPEGFSPVHDSLTFSYFSAFSLDVLLLFLNFWGV